MQVEQALVIGSSHLRADVSQLTRRAEFILSYVEPLLIRQESIAGGIADLCNSLVTQDGFNYHFLHAVSHVNGSKCWLVTVQRLVVTGYEKSYLNQVFLSIYAIIGALLVIAALILSESISQPLRELNNVAQRIAEMDFDCRADTRRKDELGVLARSINQLSDNLQTALKDLRTSNAQLEIRSEAGYQNEQRMKKLLSDLAHKFKTPLGLISSYLEAIDRGLCKDPQPYFRVIDQEIDDLTFMVNEAIELARLQSGTWRIEIAGHNLFDILSNVQQRFAGKLEALGFTLAVESRNLFVRCDAHRITQVISNFISNATKYADARRQIRIYVTCDEKHAWIHTENTGFLDAEKIPQIWQRDYGDSGISYARLPSQGIGLDIVKNILDAHGSQYCVTCENGLVTFSFSLPLDE